jgi:hypothetical protein
MLYFLISCWTVLYQVFFVLSILNRGNWFFWGLARLDFWLLIFDLFDLKPIDVDIAFFLFDRAKSRQDILEERVNEFMVLNQKAQIRTKTIELSIYLHAMPANNRFLN